jgi:hypothetical protein
MYCLHEDRPSHTLLHAKPYKHTPKLRKVQSINTDLYHYTATAKTAPEIRDESLMKNAPQFNHPQITVR